MFAHSTTLKRAAAVSLVLLLPLVLYMAWPSSPSFGSDGSVIPPSACNADGTGAWAAPRLRVGAEDACAAYGNWLAADTVMTDYAENPIVAAAVFEIVWSGPARGFSAIRENASQALASGAPSTLADCAAQATRDVMLRAYRGHSDLMAAADAARFASRLRTAAVGSASRRAFASVAEAVHFLSPSDDTSLIFRNALSSVSNMPSALGACAISSASGG